MNQAPGDPEPAPAGFVADVEIREFAALIFGDAAYGTFEGMQRGGDRAVMAGFGVAIGFEDGNDGFCFMHVETDIECLRCA